MKTISNRVLNVLFDFCLHFACFFLFKPQIYYSEEKKMFSFFREVIRQHYLILLIAIFSALFWPQIKQQYYGYIIGETGSSSENGIIDNTSTKDLKTKLFTPKKLSKYNGEKDSLGLYLSIMGSVYDVQKGAKHYGVGGSYHFFAGKN